ncbi:hypothetical protein [Desulfocicer niacini]
MLPWKQSFSRPATILQQSSQSGGTGGCFHTRVSAPDVQFKKDPSLFVHIMEQARAKYRKEQGEEMPLAMEKIYGNAVRQQIDLFKKANQEPPLNLYKREKK